MIGNKAYVADGSFGSPGLKVIDIGDPINPTFLSTVDTAGDALSVAIAGDYVYVATGASGLQSLRAVACQVP